MHAKPNPDLIARLRVALALDGEGCGPRAPRSTLNLGRRQPDSVESRALVDALDALVPEQRWLLRLRASGTRYRDLGFVFGVSHETARKRVNVALLALAEALRGQVSEGSDWR